MTIESLLPPNATPFERAIEAATARPYDIPVALRGLRDPELAPEEFLPFVAWGLSTDLWDRNWPIGKKRAVAKAWLRLHRKKGTLVGIREAVQFFGGNIVAVRRPPDATYPDPALTRAERDAYLARFRQIRFYRFRSRGEAHYGAFVGSGFKRRGLFAGGRFYPAATTAAARIGRRAFLYDPLTGVEEPVIRADRVFRTERRQAVEFDEVRLPGKAGRGLFVGTPRKPVFTVNSGARKRVFSVVVNREYSETRSDIHISGVLPSDQPIDVRPRRVKLPGQRVRGQLFPSRDNDGENFIGRRSDGIYRKFLPPSTANERLFDQIFLFDPDRLPDKRAARTFVGVTRLGMPAYHARLTVELRGKVSPFSFGRFMRGYTITASKRRMLQAIEAIRQSKSLRDKVLFTAKTMRPVRVNDAPKVGSIKVGALVRDV